MEYGDSMLCEDIAQRVIQSWVKQSFCKELTLDGRGHEQVVSLDCEGELKLMWKSTSQHLTHSKGGESLQRFSG
ncbi:Serine/Threonine-Protein Kinase Atr [Manis pentadactyla]|nr:Serine/Threonine-Protein Kinase Atr [Manis pentadactyla]